ncbi:TPA: hypothetical protein ACOEP6_002497 [Enterobacter ludwigii]
MSVTRYELTTKYRGNESWDELEENYEGAYVRHGDYAALEQRLIESERYGRQTDITIDNLEMKLAQMAAENAGLKGWASERAICDDALEQLNYTTLKIDWRQRSLAAIETPSASAFLAEVRAQGVEMFSSAIGVSYQKLKPGSAQAKALKNVVFLAVHFAAQLRQEAQ